MGLKNRNENAVFVKLHEKKNKSANGEETRRLVFTERIKDATGNYTDGSDFDTIDGILKKVSFFEYEYPKDSGIMNDGLELHIQDGEEMQIVKGNMNFATRQLLNKLLFAANEMRVNGSQIEISVKTDSDENHSVFVTLDGLKLKQMYPYQQLPKRREYQGKGGKTEYDDTPMNDFFKNAYKLILFPQFEEKPVVAQKEEIEGKIKPADMNDDLPFD